MQGITESNKGERAMKKIGTITLLIISTIALCFTEVSATEELIFGPMIVTKGIGPALVVPIPFNAKIDPITNATYVLSIEALALRTKIKVVLNSTELATRKTPFIDRIIETIVPLLDGNNNMILTVYKGEVSISVKEITQPQPPLPPVTTTLHCAVIGIDGMLVGSGIMANAQILGGKSLSSVTKEDGFCAFEDVPSDSIVVLDISSNGVAGSEVIFLSPTKDYDIPIIYLYTQSSGKISGHTEANAIVQAIFKADADYTIPNTLHKKVVISDANGFYMIDCLPLKLIRIHVNAPVIMPDASLDEVRGGSDLGEINTGNEYTKLTEIVPETETDIDTESPYRVNPELYNGDFSEWTSGWTTEGNSGASWQPYYFEEEPEDPCNPSGNPISEDLKCGLIASSPYSPYSSISQTFIVPEGASMLECRIRYRNEAYRFPGMTTTDPFSVRLETRYGTTILVEGDAGTYPQGNPPPQDLSFGLIPYSAEIPLSFSVAGLEGEAIKILAEIRHEHVLFTGMLGISDVKVVGRDNLHFHSSHSLALPSTLSFEAGMVTKLVFKNTNPVLGSAIIVVQKANGQTDTIAILANSEKSIRYSIWGCEPFAWNFSVRSLSQVNTFIFCDVYSTWVQGMPPNQ